STTGAGRCQLVGGNTRHLAWRDVARFFSATPKPPYGSRRTALEVALFSRSYRREPTFGELAAMGQRPGLRAGQAQGQRRRGVSIPLLPRAQGLFERPPHLGRLAVAVPKRLQARLEQGIFLVVLERDPLDAFFFLEVRQLDAFGHVRVADDRLRIAALGDGVEIVEQALADHHNSEVARADVFLAAVGDHALTDPGDDVLVDDVARDPAAVRVLDRAHPGRNGALPVGFASLRHAHEEPRNAERVLVVDRHAPFEMIAEVEAVRPQRDAAHGPIRIALVGVLAHPLVDEAVVEFLELELEVLAGIG